MGFWDFLAPDFASFEAIARDAVPDYVAIPPVVLSQDDVIALAWANPGSGAGLALRLYVTGRQLEAAGPALDQLVSSAINQGTAGGFGSGGGFGGSFGWRSERNVAQIIIPDTFRVSIEAESGGQVVTNVIGVQNGGGTALGAAQAVQTAWKVATGPLSQLTSLYALTGFRALDLSSSNGDIAFVADTTIGGQSTNGAKATNGAAALVKWNGGTRSRSSRGRMYFGPLREVDLATDGRTLEPLRRSAFETAFAAFRSSLSAGGYPLVVISPTLSQAFTVTTSAVESVIATQRRRIRS